ncbi:MAG: hypothetical protein GX077_07955, partial [Tissierellia bacterium]|nr:hypothetical protein [Tissierellia bacterium]
NIIESIDGIDSTGDWKEYEYRITENNDTTPWLPGDLLANQDLSGRKTVEIRRKADKDNLPSQIGKIEFTPNLELGHVRLSTHVSPLVLNGTTPQMKYRVWLRYEDNHWVYEDWTPCEPDINGNTELPKWLELESIYKIEIQDGLQPENYRVVYQYEN